MTSTFTRRGQLLLTDGSDIPANASINLSQIPQPAPGQRLTFRYVQLHPIIPWQLTSAAVAYWWI